MRCTAVRAMTEASVTGGTGLRVLSADTLPSPRCGDGVRSGDRWSWAEMPPPPILSPSRFGGYLQLQYTGGARQDAV